MKKIIIHINDKYEWYCGCECDGLLSDKCCVFNKYLKKDEKFFIRCIECIEHFGEGDIYG